jgi:hypothetical protein
MAIRSGGRWADLLFPFTHWNWKVSLLTAVLRGLACVGILRHLQPAVRWHFGLVEAAFVLLTCGFFSALQQQTLNIPREALAWLACVIVVPLASLGCDAGLHFWLDGPDTCRLGVAALIFTVVANTLHWHMIRNGALLVGDDAHSFSTDLKRIPQLAGSYFASPVVWMGRVASTAMRRTEAEESAVA